MIFFQNAESNPFKTPNRFLSKHRIKFFQNAESVSFKTPNQILSKHRIDFFQNAESVSFKTPNQFLSKRRKQFTAASQSDSETKIIAGQAPKHNKKVPKWHEIQIINVPSDTYTSFQNFKIRSFSPRPDCHKISILLLFLKLFAAPGAVKIGPDPVFPAAFSAVGDARFHACSRTGSRTGRSTR